MSRLYALGELLVDFQNSEKDTFVAKAGGAPANVAAQARKLGVASSYLTKVGQDAFGTFLIKALEEVGVDVSHVKLDPSRHTSLAFVSLGEDGEREFSFYRENAADLMISPEDFADVRFEKDDVLEFGSVSLASEEGKRTHLALLKKAEEAGTIIAFDPNLRFNLWPDKEQLRKCVLDYCRYADVIKLGKDELEFLLGGSGEKEVSSLFQGKLRLLLLTDGGKGATLYREKETISCPGFKVHAVDTTGAGDSFFGAFLAKLMLAGAKKETLGSAPLPYGELLRFACKAGAYTTLDYGAIPAMGDAEHIERKVK